jgi:hypothetical protein
LHLHCGRRRDLRKSHHGGTTARHVTSTSTSGRFNQRNHCRSDGWWIRAKVGRGQPASSVTAAHAARCRGKTRQARTDTVRR